MKLFWKILSYLTVALVGFALAVALFVGIGYIPVDPGYSKLEQLEQLIEDCFVEDVDLEMARDAAAYAMVDSLGDRWSYYMSAEEYADYQEQMANAYVGIGVTVSLLEETHGLEITQVYAGSPAEDAGLLPGDVVLAANGTGFEGLNLTEMTMLVKGPENSEVTLTVLRDGAQLEFPVLRRRIEVAVAEGVLLPENIGLVTIANFDDRCAQETIREVERLIEEGAEALIFDVRNNPGGYRHELVNLLDYLLPEGLLFRGEDYAGAVSEDHSDAAFLDMPMAVLVNSESYSAAEFFAAALMEYDAAEVVGEATCGKGYFQQSFPLLDGSAVGLSVGKYYTPKGVSLANVGIRPDVEVPVDDETFAQIYSGTLPPAEDPQIQAAVAVLTGE